MKDFKTGNRFGGGSKSGSFGRPGFNRDTPRDGGGFRGAPRRDFSRPTQMHEATCAKCGKTCEVPFLPNGRKPVFCKDCFANSRPDSAPHTFSRPESSPRLPHKERGDDHRGDGLQSQVEVLNAKLDRVIQIVEALRPSSKEKDTVPPATKIPARKIAKRAVKK